MLRRDEPPRPPRFAALSTVGGVPDDPELMPIVRAIDFGFVDAALGAS
jgi:hypothetical protein